jgi:hypothetical protein
VYESLNGYLISQEIVAIFLQAGCGE